MTQKWKYRDWQVIFEQEFGEDSVNIVSPGGGQWEVKFPSGGDARTIAKNKIDELIKQGNQ